MKPITWAGTALATLAASACGGSGGGSADTNTMPNFVRGAIASAYYDGNSDDLLTAGLGLTGLKGAAPAYTNPAAPTVAELRRNAIYTNYRAVVDATDAGGFGRLFGPNIDNAGNATLGEGKVAGREYLAVLDDGSGRQNVTLMVQVPDSFDKNRPCIVTGTSSGSRGVYGAIGTSGEWGLKRGCAVAYADKGTGNGLHDLMSNEVLQLNGTLTSRASAGLNAQFAAEVSDAERSAFNTAYPNRVAYKHAHSQQNPEKDWGLHTLQSVRLAFYVLNELHGEPMGTQRLRTITPANTTVIASSISNGGGAALAAAEQDTEGLIDGVAVSEPNAQPGASSLVIRQGSQTVATHSKPLIDYFTYANLYQPCAALSGRTTQGLAAAFWPAAFQTAAENRCQGLRDKGLLTTNTLADQANEALDKLHAYGWAPEQDFLHQSHFRFATNAIVMTYVNAHGRFSVTDNVCGFSFANTAADGSVVPQARISQAGLFAGGNGVPPTTGINVVYNPSVGGARLDFLAVSPSTGRADMALDGALCMRSLVTGRDAVTGNALFGEARRQAERVAQGVAEVQLKARLRGKPTVIVSGRSDALVPVNHASRAYVGKTWQQDGANAPLRYIEVTNAQHFDTFIAFGALLGFDTRYVPLHPYFVRAMDAVWEHLRNGTALPPSQVVRGVPRAGAPLAPANVPPWSAAPAASDAIAFGNGTLTVPD